MTQIPVFTRNLKKMKLMTMTRKKMRRSLTREKEKRKVRTKGMKVTERRYVFQFLSAQLLYIILALPTSLCKINFLRLRSEKQFLQMFTQKLFN